MQPVILIPVVQQSATAGDTIEFGANIDYVGFSPLGCQSGYGLGYWPSGPGCPENVNKDSNLPLVPAVNAGSACETTLAAIGYAVNGASIAGWGDGMSLKNNMGSWETDGSGGAYQSLAAVSEVYDVDLCGGHAANGDYHHHFYSQCWSDATTEDGTGHSEIFGFMADGYPIYGPYHDTGVRVESCWVKRDLIGGNAANGGVRHC